MKTALRCLALIVLIGATVNTNAACPGLLDQKMETLTGDDASLCSYAGKVILVVNTASQCGYTPQYDGLEKLYRKYQGRGLVVLGFPSNDFGGQEPGSGKEIAKFCTCPSRKLAKGLPVPVTPGKSLPTVLNVKFPAGQGG